MIDILGYPFEGPYSNPDNIQSYPGVYLIMDFDPNKQSYQILDVGEATDVSQGIEKNGRKASWSKASPNSLKYAVLYTISEQNGRKSIERKIRDFYAPIFGIEE